DAGHGTARIAPHRRPRRRRSEHPSRRLNTGAHPRPFEWDIQMNDFTKLSAEQASDRLTETIQLNLANPERSSDFDFHAGVEDVLGEVGMSAADGGGQLTFYGRDPIVPSAMKFGAMAAIGLAAKSVAAAAVWKQRTGEGQDVHVDVRKALQR